MAKKLLKYKMHGDQIPWYIDKPGLIIHNNFYYGISKDSDTCYIPSDVDVVTRKDLKDLFKQLNIRNNFKGTGTKDLTPEEKEDFFEDLFKDLK